jgi:hypothetical protein
LKEPAAVGLALGAGRAHLPHADEVNFSAHQGLDAPRERWVRRSEVKEEAEGRGT